MLTKNDVKYIQSLYHKKHREAESLFIAEGPKLAEELINSEFVIRKVYALKSWLLRNAVLNVPFTEISETELSRISNLQTPNEVVVIAEQLTIANEPILTGNLSLLLDGIQDPGNMGTIIRVADWFGIKQIICSNDCVEMYNPKVIQSSMGGILRVNCWYKDLDALEVDPEVAVLGALLKGQNIFSVGKVEEGLVVIGNESKGIRNSMLSKITRPVTIPRSGGAESLNAAVAAGIIVGCLVNGVGR